MKEYDCFLWVEHFRPKNIKNIILPRKLKIYFSKMIEAREIKNMIFFSVSPGSGKTTTAKAICNDIDCDFIYINASEETGIDTIRNKVKQFATVKSLNGKPKVVILDEIDSTSNVAMQKALRAFIEEFHQTCRFILTCNQITRVIDPLQSRCELVDFNMTDKKVVDEMKPKILKRLTEILSYKKVEYKEEVINKIIDKNYPDIRSMIKLLQQFSSIYDCINEQILDMQAVNDEFYDMIMNVEYAKIRKYLLEKSMNYSELYRLIFDNIIPRLKEDKRAQAISIIAEGMRWDSIVIDKEINFCATLIEFFQKCLR